MPISIPFFRRGPIALSELDSSSMSSVAYLCAPWTRLDKSKSIEPYCSPCKNHFYIVLNSHGGFRRPVMGCIMRSIACNKLHAANNQCCQNH